MDPRPLRLPAANEIKTIPRGAPSESCNSASSLLHSEIWTRRDEQCADSSAGHLGNLLARARADPSAAVHQSRKHVGVHRSTNRGK
eukprot:5154536-Pyramimonas_sp.AAC.1